MLHVLYFYLTTNNTKSLAKIKYQQSPKFHLKKVDFPTIFSKKIPTHKQNHKRTKHFNNRLLRLPDRFNKHSVEHNFAHTPPDKTPKTHTHTPDMLNYISKRSSSASLSTRLNGHCVQSRDAVVKIASTLNIN